VEFRILGPIEAREADRVLVGGAGKQVALLALLLLRRNEVIPTDRLVDDLWGDRAPRTASKTLQTYVSQLRRALGEGVIETHSHGYRLSVPDDALDADRFRAAVTAGRRALELGEPEDAASTLRGALELWRGTALAELQYEGWARAPTERLEDERLEAIELRVEADLARGRERHVLGELEGLVRKHPTREDLLALLMVALYRCGRQAEALETYRVGRAHLLEELGIEPTPRLRDLEQQILRQDVALGQSSAARLTFARRGRARRIAIAACLTVLVAAAVLFALLRNGSTASAQRPTANSLSAIDDQGRIVGQISVGESPAHALRAGGFLWTSNERDATVSRVDFANRTVETIPVGRDPEGLAFADGEVWVADAGDGHVLGIDPSAGKVVRSVRVGNDPVALASRGDLLWVVDSTDGTVTTVDTRVGRLLRVAAVGPQPTAIAAGPSSVWVAVAGSDEAVQLDRAGRAILQSVNVGNGPSAVVLSGGGVWIANEVDQTASRIDPGSGAVDHVVPLGGQPRALAATGHVIWGSLAEGTVVKLDARSGRVIATRRVGGEPSAVVAAPSGVWLTTLDDAASHRGGTLRVATSEISECPCFDPADYPSLAGWQFLDLVYDGLVAYRRAGYPAGNLLVGDLARTVPRPSPDGRTYVFRLRPGLRFSDGRTLRPSDVRASLERLFRLDVSGVSSFYGQIVGAGACTAGHACDLSHGIVGDGGDTVAFHLSAPDPDFLYKLALPSAFIVPAGSPATIAHVPLPGTGPYRVALPLRVHQLVLTRNPSFRVFSPDATPDGFPDRIVAQTDVPPLRSVVAFRRGTTDAAGPLVDLPAPTVSQLETRYPSQLHSDPVGSTEYLFLNTRVEPFSNLAARRAVNQAVDRSRLVDLLGGRAAAEPTCQILPQGFPGYRPYCPYGAAPSPAGTVTAPNLAAAAKLVAASGTYGAPVRVWAPADHAAVAHYVVRVLRRLGYKASAHIVDGRTSRYYLLVGDARTRAQVGWAGWIKDYTAPADLLRPLFTCSGIFPTRPVDTTNYSRVCNRQLDRQARDAEALQQTDPVAGQAAWSRVDRLIVDHALAVPFANGVALTLVSRRTGHYQNNPEFGVLLDQLWVR
jgi:ABC-type transport system substrate-binding protein/DNA-binding SARP family transcriptional activator